MEFVDKKYEFMSCYLPSDTSEHTSVDLRQGRIQDLGLGDKSAQEQSCSRRQYMGWDMEGDDPSPLGSGILWMDKK